MVRITASRRALAIFLYAVLALVPPAGAADAPEAPPEASGNPATAETASGGLGEQIEAVLCALLGSVCRLFDDKDGDEGASMDPFG
ncbi:MAG TPA: hypothetical protein VEG34_16560 [Thermoanaerobaculia bacterium]|nr:hypothetical protein [Thermoanaerobaculia bacterium]